MKPSIPRCKRAAWNAGCRIAGPQQSGTSPRNRVTPSMAAGIVLDRPRRCFHFPQVLRKILIIGVMAGWVVAGRAAEPERSVAQIMTFAQQPSWDTPWRFEAVRRLGGSGFVIKGKRIMTNAHVVSWARQIIVRRYQDPRPYLAEVEYVGPRLRPCGPEGGGRAFLRESGAAGVWRTAQGALDGGDLRLSRGRGGNLLHARRGLAH